MDMDTLKAECLACTRCELCATRTNKGFGLILGLAQQAHQALPVN